MRSASNAGSNRKCWLQTILDLERRKQDYSRAMARVINTPYVSDLDPWIDRRGKHKCYLEELLDRWDVITSQPQDRPASPAKPDGQQEESFGAADSDPANQEAVVHERTFASLLSLGPTGEKKNRMPDKKRLEEFMKMVTDGDVDEIFCTIGACALPRSDADFLPHQQCPMSECKRCHGKGGKAGGMFTGETLLHIAIVQHQLDSIGWLL